MTTTASSFSFVLETPPASPAEAHHHFLAKLSVETDAADVRLDLQRGQDGFLLIGARSAQDVEKCPIPGAITLPYRKIIVESTAHLAHEKSIVVSCWSPRRNSATKGALRLSARGFQVKEMLGGIEYWRSEGWSIEGTLGVAAPLVR